MLTLLKKTFFLKVSKNNSECSGFPVYLILLHLWLSPWFWIFLWVLSWFLFPNVVLTNSHSPAMSSMSSDREAVDSHMLPPCHMKPRWSSCNNTVWCNTLRRTCYFPFPHTWKWLVASVTLIDRREINAIPHILRALLVWQFYLECSATKSCGMQTSDYRFLNKY